MSNQYSTSLPSFSSEADALSYEILGGAPSQSWDVGQNMKDRILVLSSIPDIPFVTPVYSTSQPADIDQDYYSFPEEGAFSLGNTFVPSDTWGLSAANEVAQQYSAGPVIKVGLLREPKDDDDDDEDDEDDNNSMIISSNDDTLSNSVTESVETKCDDSKFTFIDSFASKYSRSIDDDKGQIAVEGDICDGGWSASDVKRHTDIANVVTDWLDMLSYMKYI